MKKLVNNLFHPSKTKFFWLYFVGGVIGILLGIMLMPIWNSCPDWVFWKSWGKSIINMIIFVCILLYLVLFLLKKIMKRSNGVIKILTIVEFGILALIALGCILQQFKVINIGGACAILGLILWCRGTVEIFRAYYHQKGNNEKYPVWWLAVSIVLVTLGAVLVAKPLFEDIHILWVFVILILLVSLVLIIDGFTSKPAKKNKEPKEKKTKENKTKEKASSK